MSATPPAHAASANGRGRTPEFSVKREKRHREDDEDNSGKGYRHRREGDYADEPERERERSRDRERRRHRPRDETSQERRERHRRRDEETDEEREERRRRRRERDARDRDRERDVRDVRRGSRDVSPSVGRGYRDRSRDSHRSHRSQRERSAIPSIREMTREEKEAEREKRDREMNEEKREAARRYDDERANRMRSPPRRRRPSPEYFAPPRRDRESGKSFVEEVDSESRSVFVSQLSAKMTSSDLGLFFEDKLGRGAVRDARIVTDKVSRRSKGIGYVELDAVELVNRALALSGTIVMGIPINIVLTEAERNRQGQAAAAAAAGGGFMRPPITFGFTFPPLTTGLSLPQGFDPDVHRDAVIPYHRLFIANLAFSLSADDLRQVFEPFGEVEFVDLHMDFSGLRKGTAYVQFKELSAAQMALDAMNGFDLAGRPIRVQTVQERAYPVVEQIEEAGGYGTRLDATQRQQLMFKLARTEGNVNLALSAPKPAPTVQSKAPVMNPTPFIVVSNMFNPEEETERNWDLDLAEDVKGEVEGKYGTVKRIKVEKMSAGEVYIEFAEIDGATAAIKGLNGRFFGGRGLQATYISETLFKAHM
ncbi:hypothetical protein IAT38_004134 [Cryptococcus sp. DSM 104549]